MNYKKEERNQIAYDLLCEGKTVAEIARFFGNTPETIRHGLNVIRARDLAKENLTEEEIENELDEEMFPSSFHQISQHAMAEKIHLLQRLHYRTSQIMELLDIKTSQAFKRLDAMGGHTQAGIRVRVTEPIKNQHGWLNKGKYRVFSLGSYLSFINIDTQEHQAIHPDKLASVNKDKYKLISTNLRDYNNKQGS